MFTVNGKPAALTQVVAYKGEPESGQPVTVLVFTTKSQGSDPKAAFNTLFNKYSNAIVAKVFPDGKVYSVEIWCIPRWIARMARCRCLGC